MRATTSCTPFAIEAGACSLCGAVEREPCAGVGPPALDGLAEVHTERFRAFDDWVKARTPQASRAWTCPGARGSARLSLAQKELDCLGRRGRFILSTARGRTGGGRVIMIAYIRSLMPGTALRAEVVRRVL